MGFLEENGFCFGESDKGSERMKIWGKIVKVLGGFQGKRAKMF